MKKVCRLCALALLYTLSLSVLSAWDTDENEIHLSAQAKTSLTKTVGFKFTQQWRTKRGFDSDTDYDSIYYHSEVGFPLKVIPGITLDPDFRVARVRTSSGWETDYFVHFNATKKWNMAHHLELAARMRVAVNDKDSKKNSHFIQNCWEARPMVTLSYKGWSKLTPFVSYEFFYDWCDDFHYRNRYYLGATYKFNSAFCLKADLVKQDDRAFQSNNWTEKFLMRACGIWSF